MSIDEILTSKSLAECSQIFGVSEPTISRWKSEKKYPQFAEIIAELKRANQTNIDNLEKLKIENMMLKDRLESITTFFKNLIE